MSTLKITAIEAMHFRNKRKSDENDVVADIAKIYGCHPLNGENFQDFLCTVFEAGAIHGKRLERSRRLKNI